MLARLTADATARTAAAVQALTNMTKDTNRLLARLVDLNGELVAKLNVTRGNFMGEARGFTDR